MILLGVDGIPFQRCIWRILHPQLTGLTGRFFGASYLFAEMQSVYFTTPETGPTDHSLGESYLVTEMNLVYPTIPADWAV